MRLPFPAARGSRVRRRVRSLPCPIRQVRFKYANKRQVAMRHMPISCNATVPAAVTADTFQCGDNHQDAAGCNFQCMPLTCVTQQMMMKHFGFFYSG